MKKKIAVSIRSKKIRTGDRVLAITGAERGRAGVILRIMGNRAIVQGLNLKKKSIKKSEATPNGGFQEFEMPIHLSNLTVCTDDDKPVKLKVRFNDKGQRELYYKLDGEDVLCRSLQK